MEACFEINRVAICLLETKAKPWRLTGLCQRLGFHQWHLVDPMRVRDGGMVLMWISDITITGLFSNEDTIDMEIRGIVRFTFIYGFHDDCKRHEEFYRISYSKSSYEHPWLSAGDFNEMFVSSEKDG